LTGGQNGAEGSNNHKMTVQPGLSPESQPLTSAIERAIAFGVDITLLIENLRLTPTERLRRAQQMLDAVVAGQATAEVWSLEKQIAALELLLELRRRRSS